mmetsp:Transcript_17510/g.29244  ORF Transcript_17510/g.29244 Transcript_17510/m.29244 type:complete len:243 (-) Transcript_17510:173-901(-)
MRTTIRIGGSSRSQTFCSRLRGSSCRPTSSDVALKSCLKHVVSGCSSAQTELRVENRRVHSAGQRYACLRRSFVSSAASGSWTSTTPPLSSFPRPCFVTRTTRTLPKPGRVYSTWLPIPRPALPQVVSVSFKYPTRRLTLRMRLRLQQKAASGTTRTCDCCRHLTGSLPYETMSRCCGRHHMSSSFQSSPSPRHPRLQYRQTQGSRQLPRCAAHQRLLQHLCPPLLRKRGCRQPGCHHHLLI